MKRKRALKILMGAGMSRNDASRFIREPFAVENDAKVFVGLYRMAVRKSHVHIMADGDKTFIRFIPKNKQPRCYFNTHLECPADRVCTICRNLNSQGRGYCDTED